VLVLVLVLELVLILILMLVLVLVRNCCVRSSLVVSRRVPCVRVRVQARTRVE
jgi:hypothetical protein